MKRVVYTCPFIPAEWVRAHGIRPSRIMPGPIPGSTGSRSGVCPYAWAFLQAALTDESADAVLSTTRCDQMRRLAEIAARDADVPVFLMNVPATWQTAAARALYRAEIERLGRFLVRLGGSRPSDTDLANVIGEYEARREALRSARAGLAPAAFWQALADLACDGECDLRPAEAPAPEGGVRLALVGGPMMRHERQLFDLIERAGGRVVLDATVSGELGLPAPIDDALLAADPLEALVDAYFGGLADASRRPNDALYRRLAECIVERGVQGIIFRHYTWCDTWHAEAQRMKEWATVPLVVTVAAAEEQLDRHAASRIEAFIEMLR
jgi:benzoyl-CoA reductase/2-hydroxyglutaryl-CoA dehydratase subunit BcrC/BadD/HgdB